MAFVGEEEDVEEVSGKDKIAKLRQRRSSGIAAKIGVPLPWKRDETDFHRSKLVAVLPNVYTIRMDRRHEMYRPCHEEMLEAMSTGHRTGVLGAQAARHGLGSRDPSVRGRQMRNAAARALGEAEHVVQTAVEWCEREWGENCVVLDLGWGSSCVRACGEDALSAEIREGARIDSKTGSGGGDAKDCPPLPWLVAVGMRVYRWTSIGGRVVLLAPSARWLMSAVAATLAFRLGVACGARGAGGRSEYWRRMAEEGGEWSVSSMQSAEHRIRHVAEAAAKATQSTLRAIPVRVEDQIASARIAGPVDAGLAARLPSFIWVLETLASLVSSSACSACRFFRDTRDRPLSPNEQQQLLLRYCQPLQADIEIARALLEPVERHWPNMNYGDDFEHLQLPKGLLLQKPLFFRPEDIQAKAEKDLEVEAENGLEVEAGQTIDFEVEGETTKKDDIEEEETTKKDIEVEAGQKIDFEVEGETTKKDIEEEETTKKDDIEDTTKKDSFPSGIARLPQLEVKDCITLRLLSVWRIPYVMDKLGGHAPNETALRVLVSAVSPRGQSLVWSSEPQGTRSYIAGAGPLVFAPDVTLPAGATEVTVRIAALVTEAVPLEEQDPDEDEAESSKRIVPLRLCSATFCPAVFRLNEPGDAGEIRFSARDLGIEIDHSFPGAADQVPLDDPNLPSGKREHIFRSLADRMPSFSTKPSPSSKLSVPKDPKRSVSFPPGFSLSLVLAKAPNAVLQGRGALASALGSVRASAIPPPRTAGTLCTCGALTPLSEARIARLAGIAPVAANLESSESESSADEDAGPFSSEALECSIFEQPSDSERVIQTPPSRRKSVLQSALSPLLARFSRTKIAPAPFREKTSTKTSSPSRPKLRQQVHDGPPRALIGAVAFRRLRPFPKSPFLQLANTNARHRRRASMALDRFLRRYRWSTDLARISEPQTLDIDRSTSQLVSTSSDSESEHHHQVDISDSRSKALHLSRDHARRRRRRRIARSRLAWTSAVTQGASLHDEIVDMEQAAAAAAWSSAEEVEDSDEQDPVVHHQKTDPVDQKTDPVDHHQNVDQKAESPRNDDDVEMVYARDWENRECAGGGFVVVACHGCGQLLCASPALGAAMASGYRAEAFSSARLALKELLGEDNMPEGEEMAPWNQFESVEPLGDPAVPWLWRFVRMWLSLEPIVKERGVVEVEAAHPFDVDPSTDDGEAMKALRSAKRARRVREVSMAQRLSEQYGHLRRRDVLELIRQFSRDGSTISELHTTLQLMNDEAEEARRARREVRREGEPDRTEEADLEKMEKDQEANDAALAFELQRQFDLQAGIVRQLARPPEPESDPSFSDTEGEDEMEEETEAPLGTEEMYALQRSRGSVFATSTAQGADPAFVQSLPSRHVKEGDEALQCIVCLDRVEVGHLIRTLPCDHSFHARCIDPWLLLHAKCPLCGAECHQDSAKDHDSDEHQSTTPDQLTETPATLEDVDETVPASDLIATNAEVA